MKLGGRGQKPTKSMARVTCTALHRNCRCRPSHPTGKSTVPPRPGNGVGSVSAVIGALLLWLCAGGGRELSGQAERSFAVCVL